MIMQKDIATDITKDAPESTDAKTAREQAKKEKVMRRRSIEEYVAKRRWREANEDLEGLYDAECY